MAINTNAQRKCNSIGDSLVDCCTHIRGSDIGMQYHGKINHNRTTYDDSGLENIFCHDICC